jgi:hypothetical protein
LLLASGSQITRRRGGAALHVRPACRSARWARARAAECYFQSHILIRTSARRLKPCQVAAAALPPLLRRLGPARRAAFVPSALEALAGDSHWNVRAAAAPLLLRVVSQINDSTEEERACTRWVL